MYLFCYISKVNTKTLPFTGFTRWWDPPPPRGGGGGGGGGGEVYSPRILVGMCRGKVKNGPGLRNELPVERENAGLRNELEPFWAWKCGAPDSGTSLIRFERENASLRNCQDASGWRSGQLLTRGAAERFAFGLSRPWEAMNGLKLKKCWKWWSPERQNPPKNVKWWCSGTDFLVI